jgi:hypothetical protein
MSGKEPDNELFPRHNVSIDGIKTRLGGILPLKRLDSTENNCNFVNELNKSGICPVSELDFKLIDLNFVNDPRLCGILPLKALSFMYTYCKSRNVPNSLAIVPLKALELSPKYFSGKEAITGSGIGEVSTFADKSSVSSIDNFSIEAGIVPSK